MLSTSFLAVFLAFPFYASPDDSFLLLYENHISLINESLANADISELCQNQLRIYYKALINDDLWAEQMFDAHGKVSSGILTGHELDLGDFDECLNIATEDIKGKYCLGTLPVLISSKNTLSSVTKERETTEVNYDSAVCIPNECTADDASKIYSSQTFTEQLCYSRDTQPELTSGGIATIAIMGFFLLLATLSTSYSLYLYYNNCEPGKKITVAFSYFINGRNLITSARGSGHLLCLDGIRALCSTWLILVHEYKITLMGPKSAEFITNRINMIFENRGIAVDTFLFIGGLVNVYSFLKSVERGAKFNIFSYHCHRYLRLTPVFAILVLMHVTLLNNFGEGPFWITVDSVLVEPCKKYFWAALLYIQNYVNGEEMCVRQSWYLSVDMQLFILSPIVLIPLKLKPNWALIGLIVLSIAGVLVSFFLAFYAELSPYAPTEDLENLQKYRSLYNWQTYGRFGTYVNGMILGYFIYKVKTGALKIKLKLIIVLLLWTICLAGCFASFYLGHDITFWEYNKWSHSLYIAFNRPAWSLVVSGIIFLCVSGYGGPINLFLSAPIFQFLSKISYTIYLVHFDLMFLRVFFYKKEYTVTYFYIFFNFWGDYIFSVALSVVLHLTFEAPMATVAKLVLGKRQ